MSWKSLERTADVIHDWSTYVVYVPATLFFGALLGLFTTMMLGMLFDFELAWDRPGVLVLQLAPATLLFAAGLWLPFLTFRAMLSGRAQPKKTTP